MARSWYAYNGFGSKTQAGSYRRLDEGDQEKPPCFSGSDLCVIYAPGGTVPNAPFSTRMTQYIIASLSSTSPQPNSAGYKYYLYKIGE